MLAECVCVCAWAVSPQFIYFILFIFLTPNNLNRWFRWLIIRFEWNSLEISLHFHLSKKDKIWIELPVRVDCIRVSLFQSLTSWSRCERKCNRIPVNFLLTCAITVKWETKINLNVSRTFVPSILFMSLMKKHIITV